MATALQPRGYRLSGRRRHALIGLAFVLPSFVCFLVFRFGPAIAGGFLSFGSYSLGNGFTWKGLANFDRMVHDPVFWTALRVTAEYTLLAVPTTLVVALCGALLTRRAFRGVGFFRSAFFLPVITSLVLAGVIFRWIFSDGGPWSSAFGWLGLGSDSWLASDVLVLPAVAVVGVWSRFGYGVLILLARLQDLPRELDEAALTDGASGWQRLRWITLPQLRSTLFFLAIIETVTSFQAFDAIYVMTGGGPVRSSYTLVFDIYDQGFKYFNTGYASAIAVALFVMTLVVAMIQRVVYGKES